MAYKLFKATSFLGSVVSKEQLEHELKELRKGSNEDLCKTCNHKRKMHGNKITDETKLNGPGAMLEGLTPQ
ncbi:MAG: hypothetical protein HY731_02495 [Candidatus Tectomicrobia bacterium]|nr:hypothetical protein [Candidatus Tectomicrobia bacterium]